MEIDFMMLNSKVVKVKNHNLTQSYNVLRGKNDTFKKAKLEIRNALINHKNKPQKMSKEDLTL